MASRGVNKVILVGNLGQDPEVKYAANGNAITTISIATSESWKDKNTGQMQDKTEWHRVVFFGKLAEIAGEYLRKGSQVYVEGKLQTRKWQDKTSGQDRYTTEVVVDGFSGVMQMLGGRNDGGANMGGGNMGATNMGAGNTGGAAAMGGTPNQAPQGNYSAPQQNAPQQNSPQQSAPPQSSAPQQNAPSSDFDNTFDDDIPF